MPRRTVTAPLVEALFDEVIRSGDDPEVAAFVKRFLRFAEQDRRYARGAGPAPEPCPPLVSSRPTEEVFRMVDDIEERYANAYYDRFPSGEPLSVAS